MVAYVVTQEGSGFAVRLTSISGQVVATFSNKLAADNFAKKATDQRRIRRQSLSGD